MCCIIQSFYFTLITTLRGVVKGRAGEILVEQRVMALGFVFLALRLGELLRLIFKQ